MLATCPPHGLSDTSHMPAHMSDSGHKPGPLILAAGHTQAPWSSTPSGAAGHTQAPWSPTPSGAAGCTQDPLSPPHSTQRTSASCQSLPGQAAPPASSSAAHARHWASEGCMPGTAQHASTAAAVAAVAAAPDGPVGTKRLPPVTKQAGRHATFAGVALTSPPASPAAHQLCAAALAQRPHARQASKGGGGGYCPGRGPGRSSATPA